MTANASRSKFTPDAASALYAVGQANIATAFYSSSLPIDDLDAYWNVPGDVATLQEFSIWFNLGVLPGHYGEVYTIAVVSAAQADLSISPHTILTESFPAPANGQSEVARVVVSREQIQQYAATTDEFFGLYVTMAGGYPVAYDTFIGAAAAGDEIYLTDTTHDVGTVTFSGAPIQNDVVTIVDSAAHSVAFTFGTTPGTQVPLGTDGPTAAANFAAFVNGTPGALVGVKAVALANVVSIYSLHSGSDSLTVTTNVGAAMTRVAMAAMVTDILFGTNDAATLVFATGAMSPGDELTINDGIHPAVQFVYASTPLFYLPYSVGVGASQTDSAQNLKAVILNEVALGNLSVGVSGAGATLTITNLANNVGFNVLHAAGATITKQVDANTYLTVTDFTGGVAGVATGVSASDTASNLVLAVNNPSHVWGDRLISDPTKNAWLAFELNATEVGFVNRNGALGSTNGSITEHTDSGNVATVTAVAAQTAGLAFWAYAAPVSGH